MWTSNYAEEMQLKGELKQELKDYYPLLLEESGHTVFQIQDGTLLLFFIEELTPECLNIDFMLCL